MDMLGFIGAAIFVVSQWVWLQAQLARIPTFMGNAVHHLWDLWRPILSVIVLEALFVSGGLVIFEGVILTLTFMASKAPFAWWMWGMIVISILCTVLQFVGAVWNYLVGSSEIDRTQLHPVTGVPVSVPRLSYAFVSRILRVNTPERLRRVLGWSHPFIWLFFIASYTLIQGCVIDLHAVRYEEYLPAQELILISLVSQLVYAVSSAAVADFLGLLVGKGVKTVEETSTLVAKLTLATLPHYKFSNALAEIGGKIDWVDEDHLVSVLKFVLTSLFMPFLLYKIIILILPFSHVQWVTMLATIIAGMVAWWFSCKGQEAYQKVASASRTTGEIAFKLGVPLGILTLIASVFLFASKTGATVVSMIGDFWFGVRFHAYGPVWISAVYIMGGVFFYAVSVWLYRLVAARIVEGRWHEIVIRVTSYAMIAMCFVGAATAFSSAASAAHQISGHDSLSLERQHESGSVMIQAAPVKYRGTNVMCVDPADSKKSTPCTLAATVFEPGTRKVLINFTTNRLASGIVEFTDVEMARSAKLPSYVVVNSQLKDCGGKTGKVCEHNASFELPLQGNPGYRVVMRNAEAGTPIIEPDAQYGKVETLALVATKHPDTIATTSVGSSSAPLLDEPNKKYPTSTGKTVIPAPATTVHSSSQNRRNENRMASACTNGCSLPPLVVLPEYR